MTNAQKLATIKRILDDGSGHLPSDETLNEYIDLSGNEILGWMYHLVGGVPEGVSDVPVKYEQVQIYSVVVGWTHAGSEGEQTHIENGVHRHYIYSDMLDYIHNHVLPYVRVGAING